MTKGKLNIESLEAFHALVQRYLKADQENDTATQLDILRALIRSEQEDYQRKLRLLAELNTLMNETRAARGTADRVSKLITAFKFAADLRAIGYDELADQETGEKATDAVHNIFSKLKRIDPEGTAALVKLFDDPSPSVRSFAAVLLLHEMPERAIPVIEGVERTAPASNASIAAGFALSHYRRELKRKSQTTTPSSTS